MKEAKNTYPDGAAYADIPVVEPLPKVSAKTFGEDPRINAMDMIMHATIATLAGRLPQRIIRMAMTILANTDGYM